ncbi:MAG: hypothetical protein J1E34_00225 [Oscillospiraceae bacterium]|nr:hypothetical protein [Oscillospiraceae bacterium]
MNLHFENPGFLYSLDSILLFQTEDDSPFWSDPILYFYPQIDGSELQKRDAYGKKEYLSNILLEVYSGLEPELNRKINLYNDHFAKYRRQIEAALSDAFGFNTETVFNDLTGNITLNPVGPRFLEEHIFDVFYKNSERGALGISIHEMIHYVWFFVWNKHFGDGYNEYERPSMKWILSEMVVESIMKDERLSSINPYFPRENGGCVYPYFQDMAIDNVPILDTIDCLYRKNNITDFMEAAYRCCLQNETAIRAHIEAAEKSF